MRLKFILPYKTILDEDVQKITAPGSEGEFQILPRHIDATWTLRSGILQITAGRELYYAIDRGVAVKQGDTVYLSTMRAIAGDSLGELSRTVEETFKVLDDKEKQAREVLVRLETETIRKFIEMEK
ncbi:MAG TPA: F0F1 ATP synthase subunit epsilon [Anaerovoracaceae bacterium]|jgi:F-type H+-transporting ATPase subunit epsilon|nr:F0F1 ATP synthase subunit epsilon [Bacillota bacterium]HRV32707.1 F0F1 ATP synthase subunit epsilon [Anaerovoracaceae bacterium]